MADFVVRPLEDAEFRPANNLFQRSLHHLPANDERWATLCGTYQPGRAFGAFAGDLMIGTALSFGAGISVPGERTLPMAAVTAVGVRADHTRRGVLSELMRSMLATAVAAGDVFAGLRVTEAVIYGRYGYGVSTASRMVKVHGRRAAVREEVPVGGEVRIVDADEALHLVPRIYERIFGYRPGLMARSPAWWRMGYERRLRQDGNLVVAVHTGPDGLDGFVCYYVQDTEAMHNSAVMRVPDFHAGNAAAVNDLWRYLLSVDLVDEVVMYSRPVDEPTEAMLVNRHQVRAEFDDELWLRPVDVLAALAGRTYQDADPVVLEIRDHLLPANSGRYRIGPAGAERTTDPADLAMPVDVLSMIYLGSTTASALAGLGLIEVNQPSALARADRLFATDLAAWCGSMF